MSKDAEMTTSPIKMTEQDLRDHRLFMACSEPDPKWVRELLAEGVNPNRVFDLSNLQTNLTLLFLAVADAKDFPGSRVQFLEIIQLLLDAGADPDIVSHPYHKVDMTPRQHAKENDGEIFAMFEQWDLGGPGKSGGGKRI